MKKTEGDIYGDIAEDLHIQNSDFQVVQDPYYGRNADIVLKNKRGGGKKRSSNEIEMITKTTNVYYEM